MINRRINLYLKEKNYPDVLYILNHLRQQDLEELELHWGVDWKAETIENIMKTDFSVLLSSSNEPIAMGGITPVCDTNSKIACVWLLSTKEVKNHRISFLKILKDEVEKAEKIYDILFNYIYQSNFEAKNWLTKLGFQFDNPKPDEINLPNGFEFFYKKCR